jgi:hypothetical protein
LILFLTGWGLANRMSGPPPKPANLRQRANKKAGFALLSSPESVKVPGIPNPDKRVWHPLTVKAWQHAWQSPMASQWLETDVDALGRLALLWDALYNGAIAVLSEIRLQEQRFGLSPLDRSRLQWEVAKVNEVERKQQQRASRKTGTDPRSILMAVK